MTSSGAADTAHDIPIHDLPSGSDDRGLSLSILDEHLDEIGAVRDVHVGEIRPGGVRGNHSHLRRGELIAVVFKDVWSLHWDTGPDTAVHVRHFDGVGGVVVRPPSSWAHAIRNDGEATLWIVALSDRPFEPDATRRDSETRVIAT